MALLLSATAACRQVEGVGVDVVVVPEGDPQALACREQALLAVHARGDEGLEVVEARARAVLGQVHDGGG